ncbi:hypothetical protein [Novipirellula artificiosorum]|uniref:Uncharacterized protein n=1 Tax=Novipirellula artificiosorum TaxID=2528016 RepID=A0A5C6DWW1_9BACT|nr:hypothetical protein [Novipirellula artificiosorum]TWU39299.1 hypothetical protein Poly41_21230 [Novipirellula artificiosorum]
MTHRPATHALHDNVSGMSDNHLNQQTHNSSRVRATIDPQAVDQLYVMDDEDDSAGWLEEDLLDLRLS